MLPTPTALIDFFAYLLPPAEHHLPLLYHTPRRARNFYRKLVLSVTPTEGVYQDLNYDTAIFLHRPWTLERRRLGPANMVLSSHQRLDELLTTGYNLSLMSSLGTDAQAERGEIIGYKGDPERKMGIVGIIPNLLQHRTVGDWIDVISKEFEGIEGTNLADLEKPKEVAMKKPKVIACMNAFEPGIMERLLHVINSPSPNVDHPNDTPLRPSTFTTLPTDLPPADVSSDITLDSPQPIVPASKPLISPSQILYITGEPRPPGVELAKTLSLPVIYIGHNRSEVWAIKHLAGKAREIWGGEGLEVVVVDEEEVKVERVKKVKREDGEKGEKGVAEGQGKMKKQKRTRPANGSDKVNHVTKQLVVAAEEDTAFVAEALLGDDGVGVAEQEER